MEESDRLGVQCTNGKRLMENDTWQLVPPPKNIIGSRWVFKVIRNADGSMTTMKCFLQLFEAHLFDHVKKIFFKET